MARRKAQTSIYETDLTEQQPELEAALRQRTAMSERRSTANQNYATAHSRVEDLVRALDLGFDAPVRVGDYIIEIKQKKESPVSFVRAGGSRVSIKPVRE